MIKPFKSLVSSCKGVIRVLKMPQFSPTMSNGVINKWHIQEGAFVNAYELILDIDANSLKKFELDKNVTLQVEIQEDMYLVKQLKEEGNCLNIGEPLAIFCEEKEDFDYLNEEMTKNKTTEISCDGSNKCYDLIWQAYSKDKSNNDCGCS